MFKKLKIDILKILRDRGKKPIEKEISTFFFEVQNEVFESKRKKTNKVLKVDELKLTLKHNENYLGLLLNERREIV